MNLEVEFHMCAQTEISFKRVISSDFTTNRKLCLIGKYANNISLDQFIKQTAPLSTQKFISVLVSYKLD